MLRLPQLRGQNQLVRLRQSQPINPAVMVDFYFPCLLQEVPAFYPQGGNSGCIALTDLGAVDPGCLLCRYSGHHWLSANENNSYLDYCRTQPRVQGFFMLIRKMMQECSVLASAAFLWMVEKAPVEINVRKIPRIIGG